MTSKITKINSNITSCQNSHMYIIYPSKPVWGVGLERDVVKYYTIGLSIKPTTGNTLLTGNANSNNVHQKWPENVCIHNRWTGGSFWVNRHISYTHPATLRTKDILQWKCFLCFEQEYVCSQCTKDYVKLQTSYILQCSSNPFHHDRSEHVLMHTTEAHHLQDCSSA